jgi:hypothetical protein
MKLKLYKVKLAWETVVLATDEEHAKKVAVCWSNYDTDSDDEPLPVGATPIHSLDDLPKCWGGGEIPWRDEDPEDCDDQREIREIIQAAQNGEWAIKVCSEDEGAEQNSLPANAEVSHGDRGRNPDENQTHKQP